MFPWEGSSFCVKRTGFSSKRMGFSVKRTDFSSKRMGFSVKRTGFSPYITRPRTVGSRP
jgi:hypothetical protein